MDILGPDPRTRLPPRFAPLKGWFQHTLWVGSAWLAHVYWRSQVDRTMLILFHLSTPKILDSFEYLAVLR
jgi:hypothetical protein